MIMQIPLEISFHGVSRSDWSEAYIREQAARLERFCDNIICCRVAVEQPHHHQHTGNPYRVRIEVRIPPNKDLVATEEPTQVEKESYLQPVIRAAFQAMERQLKEAVERRREAVQTPVSEEQPRALVVRLFREQDYGFIKTPEGRELYFHKHSVLHDDFERLEIGTEVRFVPEMGEMGPQASTVQIVNKPGARESAESPLRDDIPPGWRNA
jgi:cold shock CspA family protein/ribosome-associated translation inhibitor RaiA